MEQISKKSKYSVKQIQLSAEKHSGWYQKKLI